MTEARFVNYVEHRTGEQMQALLSHGHWIPALRGWTREYVEEHFPGWSWNGLLAVCRAAGIVDSAGGGGSPLRCHPQVKAFHFTDAETLAVEWRDGTITVRLRTLSTTSPRFEEFAELPVEPFQGRDY